MVHTQREEKADGTLVAEHTYGYDPNGNRVSDVTSKMDADDPDQYLDTTYGYTYDPRDRLSEVTKTGAAAGTETYRHDANNNVISETIDETTKNYTYDRNRLLYATSGYLSGSYNYDPYGRLDTVTFLGNVAQRKVYDGFDRVIEDHRYDWLDGTLQSSATYSYDPLDRTTAKTTGVGTAEEETTEFTYLGLSGEVLDETVANEITKSYQYTPWGERLAQVTHNTDGTTDEGFYGYNAHTDVETVTDNQGDTTATYGYTAYGNDDTDLFTGIDAPDAANPTDGEPYNVYRYNAKRWDQASGSYDMGFRNYSPGLNRFLTRDMYGGALADLNLGTNPYTNNRYAFGAGNPITNVEMDGHEPRPSHNPNYDPKKYNWHDGYDNYYGNYAPEDAYVSSGSSSSASDGGGGESLDDWFRNLVYKSGCMLETMYEGEAQCDYARGGPMAAQSLDALYDATSVLAQTTEEILIGDYERCVQDPGISFDCASVAIDIVPVLGKIDNVNDARRAISAAFNAAENGGDARRAAKGIAVCASFGADTLVLMANGQRKAISEVEIGDVVLATDPETGETGPREVIATLPHTDQLLTLRTSSGAVITTEDHRYWNETDDEWQESQDLDEGDLFLTADGDEVRVEGLDWRTVHTAPAYDLTVAEFHTFYVAAGDEAVLVHNASCPTGLRRASDGLLSVFGGGSVRGRSIVGIRAGLLDNGFTQVLSENRSGYRFINGAGEEVRIMSRDGAWHIRIMNADGNYLDEFGNVVSPSSAHGIEVFSR